MANFKLTISDVKGKSITKELKEGDANPLMGLIIGAETDAAIVGLAGKLKITGGSDKSGVPMRGDLHGMARKRVLLSKGVGLQDTEHGLRKRKLVRGNTVSDEIFQVNCKYDGEIKDEAPPAEAEAPVEEAKEEKPKEAKEEKPKEAKEEKPKEA
ncbi:MAG: S6e family ribosomal protein [Candidatus Nitrosopelagicus sp.]|nr:S6e family ribosomal protein [Candidatus Nitrosopelagicus sp.]